MVSPTRRNDKCAGETIAVSMRSLRSLVDTHVADFCVLWENGCAIR